MSESYFKISDGDRVKYVCIEAESQKLADARTGAFSGEGQLQRFEKKDLPSEIAWSVLVKTTPAWESQYYAHTGAMRCAPRASTSS
jgi:hypothetical protein